MKKTYLSIFPDGKKVAYIEAKDVFIDDGTTEMNLTSDGKNSHVDVSSFNEKIAYSSITTGAMEIWAMNVLQVLFLQGTRLMGNKNYMGNILLTRKEKML